MSKLIPIRLRKIMQTRTYTMVVLGNETKHFPIYMEPSVGKMLQIHLTEVHYPRPLTYDLFSQLLGGMGAQVKQLVIHDLQEAIYFSRLYVEQAGEKIDHIVEIDARPSDGISLALLHQAPMYCTEEVFNQAMPVEESLT